MEIDSAAVTTLIRSKNIPMLKRAHKILIDAERDSKNVCHASQRIKYPSRSQLCMTHTRIKRLKERVAKALGKKPARGKK
jgi:Co/Zn/Cd efflux system component